MCKNSENCENKDCKCSNKKETFQKTKTSDIEVKGHEEIKPKNHGKETFGV